MKILKAVRVVPAKRDEIGGVSSLHLQAEVEMDRIFLAEVLEMVRIVEKNRARLFRTAPKKRTAKGRRSR